MSETRKRRAKRTRQTIMADRRDFCRNLPRVAADADRLGLHATARLLYEAVQRVGFEVSGLEVRASEAEIRAKNSRAASPGEIDRG